MRRPAAFLRLTAFCAAVLASAGAARAADLTVELRTGRGAGVPDAVVTVETTPKLPLPARFAQPLTMAQHNLQFEPFVLVVPVGATVAFPNQDAVRHQVYSFSATKSFELKLYGSQQNRTVRFDKPGVVSVGCNIHDSMLGFIKVVDVSFAARTDAAGRVVLHGLPPGRAVVRVWHPYLKAAGNELRAEVAVPRDGGVQHGFSGELRTSAMRMTGY